MRRFLTIFVVTILLGSAASIALGDAVMAEPPRGDSGPVGLFEGHADVGEVQHGGLATVDTAAKTYTLSGSGENMWFGEDAFHYAWRQASGDLSLSADVAVLGKGTDPHRKACLMFRQNLDADSAYVDVALHGDGLTSLPFREARGAATHEVQASIREPERLRIEKRGKYSVMYPGHEGEELKFSGAAVRISLQDPFYVGIGVCSHNKDVTESAVFSKVELSSPLPALPGRPVLYSTLETQSIAATDRRVVHVAPTRFEAPNWLKDGKSLIFNSDGPRPRIGQRDGKG